MLVLDTAVGILLAEAATSTIFVATNTCLSRKQIRLAATSILLSRQKTCFVATKMILVEAPANESRGEWKEGWVVGRVDIRQYAISSAVRSQPSRSHHDDVFPLLVIIIMTAYFLLWPLLLQ